MKILVASDSHGMTFRLIDAIRSENPDLLLFLGDGIRDLLAVRIAMPELPIEHVRGNCDHWSDGEAERILHIQEHSILILHGHTQGVKRGLRKLWILAQKWNVEAALYGHTHNASLTNRDGITFFNPGSIGQFGRASYGILEVDQTEIQYHLVPVFG